MASSTIKKTISAEFISVTSPTTVAKSGALGEYTALVEITNLPTNYITVIPLGAIQIGDNGRVGALGRISNTTWRLNAEIEATFKCQFLVIS